ncbi:hypothetical protein Vi05172_g7145 [Venturia inaequalis]|nr:hypothetical protein Vi05172_g7145 [Venturia inaequalis]
MACTITLFRLASVGVEQFVASSAALTSCQLSPGTKNLETIIAVMFLPCGWV